MTNTTQPVVLIVEDEELIRMLAVDVFVSHGFIVLEAEDAAQAIAVYGTKTVVDLLFTDVNMPGVMNGIDLAEHLKSLRPELKIIIASALPILRAVDHLPATFVAKPYNMGSVCNTARDLLAA
jgi:two-component system, response regulator PdtaR